MKVVIEYVKMILIVVIVVVIVDGVILINAKIPSASMEKTIMTGDRIFGFRSSRTVRSGAPKRKLLTGCGRAFRLLRFGRWRGGRKQILFIWIRTAICRLCHAQRGAKRRSCARAASRIRKELS